ncbi:MAG: type II secretion system F family protein [Thermodesulfovibrionales bacterium]|nr:type II secretion system F family protein [Thermodesulfovibrionales bacterium]
MPLFSYEAVDGNGNKVRESLDALNEDAIKSDLRVRGLIPLSIKPVEAKNISLFERVTQKDLLIFTQELGNLLESGLPVDRALYVLSESSEKKTFRAIIREVYIDIQRGQSLSQALSKHKIFPGLYVNMIKAGEAGGILEAVIKRLASFLETSATFREEMTSALVYPMVLTIVGGLAVVFLMLYVIPKFAKIFADMGQALPLPTTILLKISTFFISYWWAVAGLIVIATIATKNYIMTTEGKIFIDNIKLKTPVIKRLNLKLIIARFSRTLGTLLQSGVPILEAIGISRTVVGNEIMSNRLKAIEDGISKGNGIAKPLKESNIFPPVVVQMVIVGEETGRLDETFLLIAERFETESRSLIKRVVRLYEPVLILLMGIVVGFIVISMLLAIFSINEIPI